MPKSQKEVRWFEPGEGPTADWVEAKVSLENPENPLASFVGNDKAKRRLSRAAFVAWQNHNHCCADQPFAIVGPPSLGKTTLVRKFAELVELPFVEIAPKAIRNGFDIFKRLADELRNVPLKNGDTLELVPVRPNFYVCPPVVLFLDEAHALPENVVQTLLKATERSDCILECQDESGQAIKMDTGNVAWFIATTDLGELFDAFVTRFARITLFPYTMEEVAQIVKLNNPQWSMDVCRLVAKFSGRVPREALAFGKEMTSEKRVHPSLPWEDVAAQVADDNNIDEYGMSLQRLTILTALGQRGVIARGRICDMIGVKEEELLKFIMPTLTMTTEDQPALVQVTGRGYCITRAGMAELDKRDIRHMGEEAIPESVRSRVA
jgi:Holliday junction resolvasome RuvABC ATP-dependent DNA helicase subunit